MRFRIWILLLLLVAAAPAQGAQECPSPHHRGAGILPYAVTENKEVLLLLGFQRGRGWTCFGGGPMMRASSHGNLRCESRKETALREALEEMRLIIPESRLKDGLAKAPSFPLNPIPDEFLTFVLQVPLQNLSAFYTNAVPDDPAYYETQAVAWIPLSLLLKKASDPDLGITGPNGKGLWYIFWKGILPELKDTDSVKRLFPIPSPAGDYQWPDGEPPQGFSKRNEDNADRISRPSPD